MHQFNHVVDGLYALLQEWEAKLLALPQDVLATRTNSQNRTIKQIIGHMVDSASNNTHRVVHLQYQKSPVHYPNYATFGNNDRWIAIQNYQNEDWYNLVQLWKFSNLHYAHIIQFVDAEKLQHEWIMDETSQQTCTLQAMIDDYLRHFNLHLQEIEQLLTAE